MVRAMGSTAMKLLDTYEQYGTLKDAAKALGVSAMRVAVLRDKLGIDKWRAKPRGEKTRAKPRIEMCEECHQEFKIPKYRKAPGRFCSKTCQGKYLGRNYGFGTPGNPVPTTDRFGETRPSKADLRGSGPVQEAIDFIVHKKG